MINLYLMCRIVLKNEDNFRLFDEVWKTVLVEFPNSESCIVFHLEEKIPLY